MDRQLTHASFFSGVGGLDLGFQRAGIRTVSVSEIDPYARAVLASRIPNAVQLGDIVALADRELSSVVQQPADLLQRRVGPADNQGGPAGSDDWKTADIWSAGFPCQDLSVAGKRKGFSKGKRSVLAFTFLNLVERFRPRWIVLENVPGLFSSNDGRDFLALLNEMDELGYGISWRTLDARFFGVPQRRRRVFIVASLGTDRAGEVLLECNGGCGHTQTSESSWQKTSSGSERSPDVAGAILARYHKGFTSTLEHGQIVLTTALTRGGLGGGFGADDNDAQGNKLVIGSQVDASGVRETDGVARRVDDSGPSTMGAAYAGETPEVEHSAYSVRKDAKANNFSATPIDTSLALNALWPGVQSHHAQTFIPSAYRKSRRAQSTEDVETWVDDGVANTLNVFDSGDTRTTHAILTGPPAADDLLPVGLDSHRYRCCGNGVVANVAEWIGHRLVDVDKKWTELK